MVTFKLRPEEPTAENINIFNTEKGNRTLILPL